MLPESAIPERTPPHPGGLVAKISSFGGYVQSAARIHQNSRSRKAANRHRGPTTGRQSDVRRWPSRSVGQACHDALRAYDESIAAKVRTLIADEAGLTEKKMFGGIAFLIGGNMACGVNKEDLIVRVDPGEHQVALAEPGVRPFDLPGRPMKGWLSVGPDGYADDRDLVTWVERSVTYARSLPAK
jgi:hypothetical protein